MPSALNRPPYKPSVILSEPAQAGEAKNFSSRHSPAASRLVLWTAPLLALAVALAFARLVGAKEPQRPRIFGIARIQIFTSDIPATRSFYTEILNPPRECNWCEDVPGRSLSVNLNQGLGFSSDPSPAPTIRLEEITFATDNLAQLRRYLAQKAFQPSVVDEKDRVPGPFFSVVDPEGHRISFIQPLGSTARKPGYPLDLPSPSNFRLIHAGFVVHDRAAMDHFYKDILGFRLYWQGGMKDGDTDWVDMQVPDGTDWIEYMLNVPANADKRELGVMNHIALGVPDIHAAEQQLLKNGMKLTEEPKVGRDGKWQLNLYDPDGTRVELMEFTPVEKPCCSDYTGPHPKP